MWGWGGAWLKHSDPKGRGPGCSRVLPTLKELQRESARGWELYACLLSVKAFEVSSGGQGTSLMAQQ